MTAPPPPTARAVVLGFVHALDAASATLREALPQLEQLADMLGLARSKQISRRGHAGGYEYLVHGFGCRLTDADGITVDVDFAGGAEVFDLWRLRHYGQSLPAPLDPPQEELLAAISGLNDLLTEVSPGWFAVSGRQAATAVRD
ncbi:DUF6896 domain-containing protein [Streptomyces sp. NPDC052236]|uniref:DUF6896 domain-containing protein n=1 Tax=Streptomyces sp. NPDC052236 TaxID=3365686 RepID=UPI0037D52207